MSDKTMTWDLDDRFRRKENRAILAFIRDKNPSAHSDISDLLIRSAADLPDVRWYCPDKWGYAYVVLYTPENRIFGIAFGMSAIAYLLPKDRIGLAIAAGGKTSPSLGKSWVVWEGDWQVDLKRWCKTAHDFLSISTSPSPFFRSCKRSAGPIRFWFPSADRGGPTPSRCFSAGRAAGWGSPGPDWLTGWEVGVPSFTERRFF